MVHSFQNKFVRQKSFFCNVNVNASTDADAKMLRFPIGHYSITELLCSYTSAEDFSAIFNTNLLF